MAQFRKKPVVIEAVQHTGKNMQDLLQFCPEIIGPQLGKYKIPTLEGTMEADQGDWIIRGVKGEFYPCKDQIFRLTYDPVDGEWRGN